MADYREKDSRYRTAHSIVKQQREQQEKNVAAATHTIRKGTPQQRRDLIGDPFADKDNE